MKSSVRFQPYIRKNVFIAKRAYEESLEIANKLGLKFPEYVRHLISEDILRSRSLSHQIKAVDDNDPKVGIKYMSFNKKMEILQIAKLLRKVIDDSTPH